MAKRKSISQTIRFEVFKRDSFTCQYCGAKAPDVILEIDHINPVAKGGDNSIENLVTSCKDCNRGKSDKKLSDMSEIEKSRRQLEELQERKNMIDMIFQWKTTLHNQYDEASSRVNQILIEETGYSFSKFAQKKLKQSIKKFGLDIMIDALYIAIDQYYDNTEGSIDIICDKYIGIAYNLFYRENDPVKASIIYIRNTLSKNCTSFNTKAFYANFPDWYDIECKEHFLEVARGSSSMEEFFSIIKEEVPND
ncbi:MAG: HNH endonuclease [Spirochaetia bacterium]|nr:HNH endonuclease [Spirochaetia bacterium]